MKNYKNKVHCVAPFSSAVISINSNFEPCCEWGDEHVPFNVDVNKTLNENFKIFDEARQLFLEAECDVKKLKQCKTCATASRQYMFHNSAADTNIDYISNPTITNLHLKFSNFCNLACRMCDHNSSSILAKEMSKTFNTSKNPNIKNTLPTDSVLYKSIFDNISDFNTLWFSGGEPLIQDQVWEIIKYCYDNNYAKNISLKFNTNGTVNINEKQKEMLLSFKHLNLDISVDGVGSLTEYIRTKLSWKKWLENFENYLSTDGIEVNLALALSVLNAQKIVEFIKYFEYLESPEIIGISMTPVWYPQELCISNLNDNAKNYLLNIYEQYPQYKDKLWTAYNMINSPRETYDIKGYIDNLDKRAKKSGMYPNYKSFSEVEPDWYNLL